MSDLGGEGVREVARDGEVEDEDDLVAAVFRLDLREADHGGLSRLGLARVAGTERPRHGVGLVVVRRLGALVDGAVVSVHEGSDVTEEEGRREKREEEEDEGKGEEVKGGGLGSVA